MLKQPSRARVCLAERQSIRQEVAGEDILRIVTGYYHDACGQ